MRDMCDGDLYVIVSGYRLQLFDNDRQVRDGRGVEFTYHAYTLARYLSHSVYFPIILCMRTNSKTTA